jgi:hypothetical protein
LAIHLLCDRQHPEPYTLSKHLLHIVQPQHVVLVWNRMPLPYSPNARELGGWHHQALNR